MSVTTAIDPIALNQTTLPSATIPPSSVPTDQPQATSGNAAEPAVVVSLSSEATTSLHAAPTTLSLDPNLVDYALSWATGVNGFAANAARLRAANVAANAAGWNEADVAAVYGTAIAERGTAVVIGAAVGSPSEARYFAANLGIPILDSVNPDTLENGATPGTVNVGAFAFAHEGSTFAVTPGPNGMLIGTKDGRAWKTWQVTLPADAADPGTDAAAASGTVTSLATEQKASDDEKLGGIDVSA